MRAWSCVTFTIAGFTMSYARYGKPRNGYDVMQLHARIWRGLLCYQFISLAPGVHSFGLGVCGPKCRKWGLVERIGTKFGGLLNWFFWQIAAFRTDIWPNLRLPELNFDRFFGLGKWGIWNGNFRICCVIFGENRILWNWKMLEKGSCGAAEGAWKGGLYHRISPYYYFSREVPPPGFGLKFNN